MKKIYLLLILIITTLTTNAQYRWELGGSFGAASYLGEMGGKELTGRKFIVDMQLARTRTTQGIYVRRKLNKSFMWRSAFSYARLSGADALSLNPGRVGRNLSFRNNIFELETDFEWVFYKPKNIARWFGKRVDLQTYLFAGGAVYHHDPVTTFNGDKVKLRPLKTEGVAYKPWQVSIPMGIGAAYIIGKTLKVGLEVSYRKVFTDYIDDVSTVYKDPNSFTDPTAKALANRRGELDPTLTEDFAANPLNYTALSKRGDPKNLDDIFYLQATVGYVLKGKNSFYKSKYRSITGRRGMKKRRVRAKF
jgi:hypothetical protein